MKIAILILAAGSSTRMGVPKQLLPAGKTTLLGITIQNALEANAAQVFCVLGANAELIKASISQYNMESIINCNYESGLSSSIVRGIEHIMKEDFDALLIVLGDQPLITTTYFDEMINSYKSNIEVTIATSYNGALGVPALIPKSYFNELLKLKGDKGAKDWLNSRKDSIILLNKTNVMDVDTDKDYRDYLNSIKSG